MTRSAYDDAVSELYRAPQADFIATRKRLAGELKAAGDKAGAATLAKLARPPVSAWAVNQLWWQARDDFERMLDSAAKLRGGDMAAQAEHRAAIAALRSRAAKLVDNPSEATLRRVTTTLSALAVAGGFEPDPPGALSEDREPPGFAAVGIAPALVATSAAPAVDDAAAREARHARERADREAEEALQRERVARERARLDAALHAARAELAAAERQLAEARERVAALERDLAALPAT
nr:hypothetical protein [Kofleriaceae bacterium]